MQLTNEFCDDGKKICVNGVGEHEDGICSARLQRAIGEAMNTTDISRTCSMSGPRLAPEDRKAITMMARNGVDSSLESTEARISNNFSTCVKLAIRIVLECTSTNPQTRPRQYRREILRKGLSFQSLGYGTSSLFIDEASRHVSVCHVNTKKDDAWLLERHGRTVGRQTNRRLKRLFLIAAGKTSKERKSCK